MTAPALHVIKLGSSTLLTPGIFDELAELSATGARILLVAGGAEGIEQHYGALGRRIPELELPNGDSVRYCPPEEMPHIVDAYERITLPSVVERLTNRGLSVFAQVGAHGLVSGRVNRPLKTRKDGRNVLVRDHRAGSVESVAAERLSRLLDANDVVCLAPPIADLDGGSPLNVDADMLAAAVSNGTHADHLRLVTGTAGLLTDPRDPRSTLAEAFPGTGREYASGRMRQKVRAAEAALNGSADVAVTGPHTLSSPQGRTRFWRPEPDGDLALLSRAVQIPSVSGDENALAEYLESWCRSEGIASRTDEAGNLVAERGTGPRTLMLLGHMDTVPFHWPPEWDGDRLSGRGSVDAKASLATFLEVLRDATVPPGWRIRVVGAVEEEISSSRGAFHVRDNYPAEAVVIGEPSGSGALTLGYYGLFKLRITASVPSGHSAGFDALSAPDALIGSVETIRSAVLKEAPEALSAVIDMSCASGVDQHSATGILNFRIPPDVDVEELRETVEAVRTQRVSVEYLRATPGYVSARSSPLTRSFGRALRRNGLRPRYLLKKGTADMNTLATTWRDVPMVAYGPGDSALDHTEHEHVTASEYRAARSTLADAVAAFLSTQHGGE
ncbi:M20/M25/M40 family metallo-hydrolase [Actinopolyspora mortivallis]|uniref:M20/M25/M40 family metallo-hydrolase n=1 Tax=Actinopolyspora mortivallis TaxID=33906 RepID=UPI000378E84B|nr:M20/M25/M40 family metallo-hydrolase [Actinopolyspora mortivallis]